MCAKMLEFEERKSNMLARKRRVVFNNDGGDATLGSPALKQPQDFVDLRTSSLLGSHVDTVSYCSARGFGVFTHATREGQSFVHTGGRFENNVIPALLRAGTDPLEVMVTFCREHDLEIFWSMQMIFQR